MGLALGTARKRWYLEVTRLRWLMLSQMTLQRVSGQFGHGPYRLWLHSHQSCAATHLTATQPGEGAPGHASVVNNKQCMRGPKPGHKW
jgi:hypothetical protein